MRIRARTARAVVTAMIAVMTKAPSPPSAGGCAALMTSSQVIVAPVATTIAAVTAAAAALPIRQVTSPNSVDLMIETTTWVAAGHSTGRSSSRCRPVMRTDFG